MTWTYLWNRNRLRHREQIWGSPVPRGQRRQWHPTPVLLPGKSHGRRSLVGCSPWGRKSRTRLSDFTFTFLFSCTGEGNGNTLQYSCLENPRDDGAWWAAVYGVAQSQTQPRRLSSSSSILSIEFKTICNVASNTCLLSLPIDASFIPCSSHTQ